MKFFIKIKCLLGLHVWDYQHDAHTLTRTCNRCPAVQRRMYDQAMSKVLWVGGEYHEYR